MSAVNAASRPRVGVGFRLQWEMVQNCHVLLYPEGMVKLNRSAGEILQRCDGAQEVTAIVTDLERSFNASDLSQEVLAFLEIALQQKWVELA
ncbi:MAG: pyrroloquinoline quinone biosynthesis peptide chaperone PqqD [Rhodoferax sp.]|nr:pyrroloquinoline quinone biosynthesis peptide chaperone PqqD [Rhodoferax sp.]